MQRPLRTLTVAAAILLAAGCGAGTTERDAGVIPSTYSPGAEGGTPSPIIRVDAGELDEDERGAVSAVDAFWRETFPAEFGRSYQPPQVRGAYVGEQGPSCSGQQSVAFNAFYCPSEDFVAWDRNLMATGYEQIGDAWVYLIIAHEWAHAIQARLERDQVSPAAELQADCLAAASIFGAAERNLVTIEPGDTEELARTLAAVADDYPWTDESDHGDARQRTASFGTGARGGVDACIVD